MSVSIWNCYPRLGVFHLRKRAHQGAAKKQHLCSNLSKIQIHLIVDSRGKDEFNLHEISLEIVFLMFENNVTGCEH